MLFGHLARTLEAGGRIQKNDSLMDQDWLLLLDEKTYRVRPISESPNGENVEVFFLDSPDHEKMTGGDVIQSSNLKPVFNIAQIV